MAKKGSSSSFTSATKGSEGQSKGGLGGSVTVAEYGDVDVKAVVDIDISPLSGDVSYDTSSNELGVSGEAKIPGGVVGVGGGIVVDLDTGEITGGSVSLGAGGADVEVSVSKCEQTLQVTYFGVGFAVSKDTCNDDEGDEDEPPPPPPPPLPPGEGGGTSVSTRKVSNPGLMRVQAFSDFDYVALPGFYFFYDDGREPTPVRSFSNRYIDLDEIIYGDFYIIHERVWENRTFVATSEGETVYQGSIYTEGSTYFISLSEKIEDTIYAVQYLGRNVASGVPSFPVTGTTGDGIFFVRYYPKFYDHDGTWSPPKAYSISYNYEKVTSFSFSPIPSSGSNDNNYNNKNRRSIPPSENMSECCDASISLMRKIAKVLAVDEMLKPAKVSGKILKDLEKGIDKVLADPDLVIEMDNYLELNSFLSLLSNRKVSIAVGADELEFEKDEKNPKFHYLRWLKEYSEGKTPLDYQEWLTAKDKKEGLKASTTQFKSIPQLMIAELYNSKTTVEVLRAHDLMKKGMQIPNELFTPGGLGFTEVNDYPNIFKKLIQILDLSTIQPFTAVLQDSDPSKEGDQTLTRYYPDATSAVKEIVELLLENKVDGATRLNILMRQSILNTQQQVALLETLSIAYTIMYGLGLPFYQKGSHFVAPFDVSPNTDGTTDKTTKGKGFNPKNKKEDNKVQSAIDSLNENSENATEKMLPDFLSTVRQEYLHTYFDDKKESLWYYIMSVFMKT